MLDAAQRAGIPMGAVCGGRGSCGKCLVRILEGPTPPVSPAEERLMSPGALHKGQRLACRTGVTGAVVVEVLRGSSHGKESAIAFPASFAVEPPGAPRDGRRCASNPRQSRR